MSDKTTSSLKVTGLRREPRVDGVLEWSRGVPGNLSFGTNQLTFNNWSIQYDRISDAVLNKETVLFRKTQTLAIKSDEGEFMFSLHEPIERKNIIPFQIRITERKSFIGKLFLLVVIMLFVNIAWDILKSFM